MKTLQELIQNNVNLTHATNSGFHPIECAVCNDHSQRAGFKFENGTVGYHCFNCKAKFLYTEGETIISNRAVQILECFGISKHSIMETVNSNFFETGEITFERIMQSRQRTLGSLIGTEVKMPKHSFFVGSDKHPDIEKKITDYLASRMIDPYKVKAMYSLSERHIDRVLLPIYQKGTLIHWQSRAITSNIRPKYLTCNDNHNVAIWGLHNSYKHSGPLFITEGIFDASLIDGVAILGSTISPEQVSILEGIRRKKVIVVDYDSNGSSLATTALHQGWDITFAAKGKDVNKTCMSDGLIYTIHTLMTNITTPSKGDIEFNGVDLQSILTLNLKML